MIVHEIDWQVMLRNDQLFMYTVSLTVTYWESTNKWVKGMAHHWVSILMKSFYSPCRIFKPFASLTVIPLSNQLPQVDNPPLPLQFFTKKMIDCTNQSDCKTSCRLNGIIYSPPGSSDWCLIHGFMTSNLSFSVCILVLYGEQERM